MKAECGLAANALGAFVRFVGVGGGGAGSLGLNMDALFCGQLFQNSYSSFPVASIIKLFTAV
jgi:hypothetical protein